MRFPQSCECAETEGRRRNLKFKPNKALTLHTAVSAFRVRNTQKEIVAPTKIFVSVTNSVFVELACFFTVANKKYV